MKNIITKNSINLAVAFFIGVMATCAGFIMAFSKYRVGAFACLLCQALSLPFIVCLFKKKIPYVSYAVIAIFNLINFTVLTTVKSEMDDLRFTCFLYAIALPTSIAFFLLCLLNDKNINSLNLAKSGFQAVKKWNQLFLFCFGVCLALCSWVLLLTVVLKHNPYVWVQYTLYSVGGVLIAAMMGALIFTTVRNKAVSRIVGGASGSNPDRGDNE
ncbi:MAG: hypothetical protein NC184_02060 [Roseburia sp.]|nr:hypothetical protein [Roseburia sp.]